MIVQSVDRSLRLAFTTTDSQTLMIAGITTAITVDKRLIGARGEGMSDGERAKNHHSRCGGRCAVFYAEDRRYQVVCEHCGALVAFRTTDQDRAIKIWNDMPDVLEGKYGR